MTGGAPGLSTHSAKDGSVAAATVVRVRVLATPSAPTAGRVDGERAVTVPAQGPVSSETTFHPVASRASVAKVVADSVTG